MNYYFDVVKPIYYESIKKYRNEMLESNSSFDGCFQLQDYEDIEKWHLNNLLFENKDSLPPGYSIGYQYLYLENDEVVGMLNFRPKANEHKYLSMYGGHIGYSVLPSKRRNGIASKMLHDFLIICKEKTNLDKVLITCFEDNEASKKVILNNGGKFESSIMYNPENKVLQRYWIKL